MWCILYEEKLYDYALILLKNSASPIICLKPGKNFEWNKIEYGENTYAFIVYCSSGTYIRTLCADIGKALGCGACMGALKRISSNGISIDRCYDYNDLLILAENGMIEKVAIPFESAFSHLERITIPESGRVYYLNGGMISSNRIVGLTLKPDTDYIACAEDGTVLGLAHTDKGLSVKSLWNK